MGDKVVDSEGYVHERGWDGQYHQSQGLFGPQRELDIFGNPKVGRDVFGNPEADTDLLRQQSTGGSGQLLFRSACGGGGGSSSDIGGAIGGWIAGVVLFAAFTLLFCVVKHLVQLCRKSPIVGFPMVLLLVLLFGVWISQVSQPPAMAARPVSQAPQRYRPRPPRRPLPLLPSPSPDHLAP